MGKARPFFGFALAAAALLSGCGGEARDATSRDLAALTAEISKLRAEQAALAERLDAIERAKTPAPAPAAEAPRPAETAPVAAAKPLDDDRPSLETVKLGPASADEGDGDVDADGPRTVLRSGANGIVVEEQAASGGTTRTVVTDPKKAASSKKADKSDRKKKTASLPTP